MQILGIAALAGIFFANPQLVEDEKMKNQSNGVVNGVNTKNLRAFMDQLQKEPKAGQVTFFSDTKWQGGMKSMTTVSSYMVDGVMKGKNRKYTMLGDEMTELGGSDTAPGAVEELMYAVGTCIVAAANANAALLGVKLSKIEVFLKSNIDLHGLFALDPKVAPGILNFETTIKIAGNATSDTLKEIAMKGYTLSPVSDTVQHGAKSVTKPTILVE